MRILYVAMKYDYGRPEQGESFEHWNFYDSLVRMGHSVLYFDFGTLLVALGRDGLNRKLVDVARAERADVLFSVLFRDEFEPSVFRRISRETGNPTVNWFCDDVWRFDDFTRRFAPSFDWSVTTATSALPRYAKLGVASVIKSQWACNHWIYRRLDRAPLHDVTFIGQPHSARRATIDALRAAGLRVETWGKGWENGRLTQEQMIEIFNASRINLNLANASSAPPSFARRSRETLLRVASATLRRVPGSAPVRKLGKELLFGTRPAPAPAGLPLLDEPPTPSQMKGRNFEVPGCGAFLLTDPAVELSACYEPGREIGVFDTLRNLIDRTRYYLEHEEERAALAQAGHARTLREHTYVHRFCEIFRTMGLPTESAAAILSAPARRGETEEIR